MPGIRFVVDAAESIATVTLDPSQAAVLALPDGAAAAVLGAPGTGKTTTIVEFVADRVARGLDPEQLLVLTPSRASATRLRDGSPAASESPTDGPLARTVPSLAFEVVGAAARAAGAVPPRLLTGAEQDADIAAILAGHIDDGSGPTWPEPLVREVRESARFPHRAARADGPRDRVRGRRRQRPGASPAASDRPDWAAAADFLGEYLQIVARTAPTSSTRPSS